MFKLDGLLNFKLLLLLLVLILINLYFLLNGLRVSLNSLLRLRFYFFIVLRHHCISIRFIVLYLKLKFLLTVNCLWLHFIRILKLGNLKLLHLVMLHAHLNFLLLFSNHHIVLFMLNLFLFFNTLNPLPIDLIKCFISIIESFQYKFKVCIGNESDRVVN